METFEIIFSDISFLQAVSVLKKISENGRLCFNENIDQNTSFNFLNEKSLKKLFELDQYKTMYLKLSNLSIGNHQINDVFIRILGRTSIEDLELSFDLTENIEQNKDFFVSIHDYCKGISEEFDINQFIGGYEPATDEDTRAFTNYVFELTFE
jgi:hypothetical protein